MEDVHHYTRSPAWEELVRKTGDFSPNSTTSLLSFSTEIHQVRLIMPSCVHRSVLGHVCSLWTCLLLFNRLCVLVKRVVLSFSLICRMDCVSENPLYDSVGWLRVGYGKNKDTIIDTDKLDCI